MHEWYSDNNYDSFHAELQQNSGFRNRLNDSQL